MSKAKRRQKIVADREYLVERFPRAFMPKGADKMPLKVGIYHDIRESDSTLSAMRLNAALDDYVRGPKYLRHVVSGANRIDLNGAPVGVVTDQEELSARFRLANLYYGGKLLAAIRQLREVLLEVMDGRAHNYTDTEQQKWLERARAALEQSEKLPCGPLRAPRRAPGDPVPNEAGTCHKDRLTA